MGQDYSKEQKSEFRAFRILIDAAINDKHPYLEFKNSVTKISKSIIEHHPFNQKYGISIFSRLH